MSASPAKTRSRQQPNAALFRATSENVSREVLLRQTNEPEYWQVIATWRKRSAPRTLTRQFIQRLASTTGILGQPDPSGRVSER